MARKRLKIVNFISKLKSLSKSYFTAGDLERILDVPKANLNVTLNRLVKSKVVIRLRKNIYILFTEFPDVEKIANELYFPCYLSFESALSRYGILSQIPYTLTFATTRPSKKMIISDFEVEFRHLKDELFFGYIIDNGKNIATPEKALLDELYMKSRGKAEIDLEELDLSEINKKKLKKFTKRFPVYVKKLIS